MNPFVEERKKRYDLGCVVCDTVPAELLGMMDEAHTKGVGAVIAERVLAQHGVSISRHKIENHWRKHV